MKLTSESQLVSVAKALKAHRVPELSDSERRMLMAAEPVSAKTARLYKAQIQTGGDPLGSAFCRIRSPRARRASGATFTPERIIQAMTEWALAQGSPLGRIVDPGTGSGRFLLKAAHAFSQAELLGIEIDPLAALTARANLSAAGLESRSRVVVSDYRSPLALEDNQAKTLFIGNPPYLRHHGIESGWKAWLSAKAASLNAPASQLAGLHAYFFLSTVLHGKPGDLGVFVTSAEWLDVNYGKLIRHLFLDGLGGQSLTLIDPKIRVFEDAATTAAICCFKLGSRSKGFFLNHVSDREGQIRLGSGRKVQRERLVKEQRWSRLILPPRPKPAKGLIELGELCRVHRGQVTGANRIWIEGPHSAGLPDSVLFPSVTRASDLFKAGLVLEDAARLRRVIDIPADLSLLSKEERKRVERFLRYAKSRDVHQGYIASNRKAWWSVGLKEPAPILSTYMARRPPAFVRNLAKARHINIAHGIYPRQPLEEGVLQALVRCLSNETSLREGRSYAGGLVKFEPKEVERLLIPSLDQLQQACHDPASKMDLPTAH